MDPKFIDNTAVSDLDMTGNICSQLGTRTRNEIKPSLKKCFENYQPRRQHQSQNICGKPSTGQGDIIGGSQISRGIFPW